MYYTFKYTVNKGAFVYAVVKEESGELTTSELFSLFGHFSVYVK